MDNNGKLKDILPYKGCHPPNIMAHFPSLYSHRPAKITIALPRLHWANNYDHVLSKLITLKSYAHLGFNYQITPLDYTKLTIIS